MNLKQDANAIIKYAIKSSLPDNAVFEALKKIKFLEGNKYVIAVGKAAWQMAQATTKCINDIEKGIVITKYNHVNKQLPNFECYEAGHPISDKNTYEATKKVIDLCKNLKENDNIIFLVSGGGSALFELPLIDTEELENINNQLLSCGASIVEINAIRKKLSSVKGGKFAKICYPAKIYNIILSDIVGNPLDMIASGPTYLDKTPKELPLEIVKKYNLKLSEKAKNVLNEQSPVNITNTETYITGSVDNLCKSAAIASSDLGYKTYILTSHLECEAKEAGLFLAAIAKTHQTSNKSLAIIAGGETTVHITGNGLGGRNQEIALSAARKIDNLKNIAIFSVGSDGTDGPTDAAGAYVDFNTKTYLEKKGYQIDKVLKDNNSYNALKSIGNLIQTGPTGTNVNDISVVLIKR